MTQEMTFDEVKALFRSREIETNSYFSTIVGKDDPDWHEEAIQINIFAAVKGSESSFLIYPGDYICQQADCPNGEITVKPRDSFKKNYK